jgi:hypothetical protein
MTLHRFHYETTPDGREFVVFRASIGQVHPMHYVALPFVRGAADRLEVSVHHANQPIGGKPGVHCVKIGDHYVVIDGLPGIISEHSVVVTHQLEALRRQVEGALSLRQPVSSFG